MKRCQQGPCWSHLSTSSAYLAQSICTRDFWHWGQRKRWFLSMPSMQSRCITCPHFGTTSTPRVSNKKSWQTGQFCRITFSTHLWLCRRWTWKQAPAAAEVAGRPGETVESRSDGRVALTTGVAVEEVLPAAHPTDVAAAAVELLAEVVVQELADGAVVEAVAHPALAAVLPYRLLLLAQGADHVRHRVPVDLVGGRRVGVLLHLGLVVAEPAPEDLVAAGCTEHRPAPVVLTAMLAPLAPLGRVGVRRRRGRMRRWRGGEALTKGVGKYVGRECGTKVPGIYNTWFKPSASSPNSASSSICTHASRKTGSKSAVGCSLRGILANLSINVTNLLVVIIFCVLLLYLGVERLYVVMVFHVPNSGAVTRSNQKKYLFLMNSCAV